MFGAMPTPMSEAPKREALTVDYTSRPIGTAWGKRKVTVTCPECGRPGLFMEGPTYDKWVHCVELNLDSSLSARMRTISSCNNKARDDK